MSGDHNKYASGSGDGQRSGWRKRTIMEMAREAGGYRSAKYPDEWRMDDDDLERFAELVRADERNRTWTQEHWTEYENSIAAAEREALENMDWTALMRQGGLVTWGDASELGDRVVAAIRARGQA